MKYLFFEKDIVDFRYPDEDYVPGEFVYQTKANSFKTAKKRFLKDLEINDETAQQAIQVYIAKDEEFIDLGTEKPIMPPTDLKGKVKRIFLAFKRFLKTCFAIIKDVE